jgi:zinc transport system ATP-binding protein
VPAPALLLLDEPVSAMDEAGERRFEKIVRELVDEGVSVLWIAHDFAQVRRLAYRVTCLNRTVRFDGPPDEVLVPEKIAEAFGPHGTVFVARPTERLA